MQLFESVFILLIASLSTEASKLTDQESVFNGHSTLTTDEEYWPWVAAIYQSGNDGLIFKCTGTLINSSLVLTSARCMVDQDGRIAAQKIEVHLGKMKLSETDLNKNQKFAVDEIIVHPDYDAANFASDLAIIRLSSVAILNDFVQPISLWNSNRTETSAIKDEIGTTLGWGITQITTDSIPDTVQNALMTTVAKINCLNGKLSPPDGSFCAFHPFGIRSGSSGASMLFRENGVYTVRGIMSEVVLKEGHNSLYAIFTDVAKFTSWIQETESNRSTASQHSSVCRPNEEFVHDRYRCDETCEEYGNPICFEDAPEAKCYCKKGFVRLKTVGICVTADNRACLAKMPPTEEKCAAKQNERLSEWLYDEPCANTCENYNIPCNVSVPDGMFWGPHCVCKEGFSRLPNQKCTSIDDPKCKELWNPTPSTTTPSPSITLPTRSSTSPTLNRCNDFCGRFSGLERVCSQFDLGMQYSSAGAISGKHCTQLIEVADPHTWSDNFICFNSDHGVRWSSAGAISGMECTQILEVADPHTWHDNFLCVPQASPFRFRWSSSGPISGLCCVQIHETAEPLAHTWFDNFLCVTQ